MLNLTAIDTSNTLNEQAGSAIKILEHQINFLNNQIRLRHKPFDLKSITTLWSNKRDAIKHLDTLKRFTSVQDDYIQE